MQNKTIVAILGILTYAVFLGIGWTEGTLRYYWPDALFFTALILFFCFSFSYWRLNVPVYTLLVLSFALHMCGIFGWYNVSPVKLSWDHITHAIPLFTFTVLLYNFARQWMPARFWTAKTWGLMLLVLLSGLGIGAIVENIEFFGYLTVGAGEGGLFFGGAGDGQPVTSAQMDIIQDLGGGYINTELDLVWNGIGAVFAVILMSLIHFARKKEPSGTAQSFPQTPYPLTSSWRLR